MFVTVFSHFQTFLKALSNYLLFFSSAEVQTCSDFPRDPEERILQVLCKGQQLIFCTFVNVFSHFTCFCRHSAIISFFLLWQKRVSPVTGPKAASPSIHAASPSPKASAGSPPPQSSPHQDGVCSAIIPFVPLALPFLQVQQLFDTISVIVCLFVCIFNLFLSHCARRWIRVHCLLGLDHTRLLKPRYIQLFLYIIYLMLSNYWYTF